MGLFSLTQELAIDLGTANTIIIHNGKIVVDEPSIVALDYHSGKLVAIGNQARQMHGKTHQNIKTIRPLKDGVIADFNATELMLRGMIKKVKTSGHLFSPSLKMVICIPSGSTNVEIRAVRDSAEHAGGREVYMIYEPMAAALGAGLDVEAPEGHMIIDIGGGTTDFMFIEKHNINNTQSAYTCYWASIEPLGNEIRKAMEDKNKYNSAFASKYCEMIITSKNDLAGFGSQLRQAQTILFGGGKLADDHYYEKLIEANRLDPKQYGFMTSIIDFSCDDINFIQSERLASDQKNPSSFRFVTAYRLATKVGDGNSRLQMRTFMMISGFEYHLTKDGRPYGWGTARYALPEAIYPGFEESIDEWKSEEARKMLEYAEKQKDKLV